MKQKKEIIVDQLSQSDKDLLEYVKRETDEGSLWEYQIDFLPMLMTEFILSDLFNSMMPERKRDLVEQYYGIMAFLDVTQNYANDVSSFLELTKTKRS